MATWHYFDLVSGRRGVQVTTKEQGVISRLLCEATSTQLDVSCWDETAQAPRPDWDAATTPGRAMLVCLDDMERILWGGMVLTRTDDDVTDEWVQVSLVTLESYLDRRYVTDNEWDQIDQGNVFWGITNVVAASIGMGVDAPAQGVLIDYTTADTDDKTVLAAITELSQLAGGPEFTVDLAWTDSTRTKLAKTLVARKRVGTSLPTPSRWTLPGCLTNVTVTEDYSTDNGANDVLAVSTGDATGRPTSDHQVATALLAAGWARFETRFSPSTSETDVDLLNSYATAKLAAMNDGGFELALVARGSAAPVINSDWFLGDDIMLALSCPRFPERLNTDGALVAGYERRVRDVGWEWDLDEDALTPTIREVA